jgi:hypothetical protein
MVVVAVLAGLTEGAANFTPEMVVLVAYTAVVVAPVVEIMVLVGVALFVLFGPAHLGNFHQPIQKTQQFLLTT